MNSGSLENPAHPGPSPLAKGERKAEAGARLTLFPQGAQGGAEELTDQPWGLETKGSTSMRGR